MLEGFAAWLLNTYIGDYFGNVNTDQLRMSLHSGEIELERLPLKRDLLKHLGLPLEASTGYIGKISIKFPRWHLFTSEPLVITIDELYLLVRPITNFTYNEEEENRAQQEFKMSQLDMLEQRWKALHDELTESQSSYYSSSYSSWLRVANYGSSFFTNILLNVHLKIGNIHIRYEDASTIPGCPFATGCVFRSLSVCSTDENWEPKYVTREHLNDRNLLFKMIELESFSVYFDTDTGLYEENIPPNEGNKSSDGKSNSNQNNSQTPPSTNLSNLVDLMRSNVERNQCRNGTLVDHGYIIAPVNGRCYLKRNSSEMSLKSCRQPRTVIDVQLEQVPIMMTAIQYKHLLDWSLAFQTSKTLWRYRKWRPMISRKQLAHRKSTSRSRTVSTVTEDGEENYEEDFEVEEEVIEDQGPASKNVRQAFDARTWWHFAVNANLEEYRQRRQRFNWHFILRRARDIVAYHSAYLHYLVYPELYSKEMRHVKERVEAECSLDEICSIREIVFAESDRLIKEDQQGWNLDRVNAAAEEAAAAAAAVQQSSSGWFFPYSVLSNLYYNYGTGGEDSAPTEVPSESPDSPPQTQTPLPSEDVKKSSSRHRRNASTSSTGSLTTDDIFLLRDAVFCQFNFQIKNSSFQLIAFNSAADESGSSTTPASSSSSSGNLLLEFEFNQMKIGVDITNPNAYACVCHMNQGWRRRANQTAASHNSHQSNHQQTFQNFLSQAASSPNKAFLTQNELNMLQFNLHFQCQNLELTLLRTEGAFISNHEDGASKLATAQLTGCGLLLVFSSHFVSIDGRLDSLEILDLVAQPRENKHRRVLSIGAKQTFKAEEEDGMVFQNGEKKEMIVTEVVSTEDGFLKGASSSNQQLEKAFSFSLSRQFTENMLRLNIEMASFCYVHSAVLVAEMVRCRECFSDVLEAYFSRSFKERVKAATTEMLRGIVKSSNSNGNSGTTAEGEGIKEVGQFKAPIVDASNYLGARAAQKMALGTKQGLVSRTRNPKQQKNQQISPFIDNFKLNIFIRSPVIIFPISPASLEVVVFHLGHMLLNNHNHSSEMMMMISSPPVSKKRQMPNGGIKVGNYSPQNNSNHSSNSMTTSNSSSDSYNAEIRDLSVYSLDCARNIAAYEELFPNVDRKCSSNSLAESMPMSELYYCESYGVPILSKTVIEIVLEKKVLLSSFMESAGRPLSSRLSSLSPQPPQKKGSSGEMKVGPKTSTSSTGSGHSAEDSVLIDGLNIISTVNSIDPFRPPKKFSIRSHMVSNEAPGSTSADHYYQQRDGFKTSALHLPKPELVLSVEVSSIDVRFSYTDVLVFLHILNTLMPPVTNTSTEKSAAVSTLAKVPPKEDEENSELNMEELEEMFRCELERRRSLSKAKDEPKVDATNELKLADLDPAEFKLRLDKLQDLGFEYGESLKALALTGGDVIEAAFALSSKEKKVSPEKSCVSDEATTAASDDAASQNSRTTLSTENKSASYQNLLLLNNGSTATSANGDSTISQSGIVSATSTSATGYRKRENIGSGSSSLLSSLAVIELRVASGTMRIIDDCNQLDIPLLELGFREGRLLQQNGSPVIEATAQANFYCDLYNSHLSGWEPVVEGCTLAASWKMHHRRAQLKSMLTGSAGGLASSSYPKAARRKLALKIELKKPVVNVNVSRTMLDMAERVRTTWSEDIAAWMALPAEGRSFRKRSPFIPFALKNETGSDVQLLVGGSRGELKFSTGKAPDLVTHCDLRDSIEASAGQVVCFDIVDYREQHGQFSSSGSSPSSSSQQPRWSTAGKPKAASASRQKITVKVEGWSVTSFPVSIEREGTFIRHLVSEKYFNQSAVLVFEIALQQPSAVKLITVRSSLQVVNKTTKKVELSFANTASMSRDVQTSYILGAGGVLPVPLSLLYARMQLRPCDLGLGACRTPINWAHVRRYGEQCCSLQICTPITHSSAASYSASAPYVVTVLVERNAIGALIESRRSTSALMANGISSGGVPTTMSSSASSAAVSGGTAVYGHTPLVTIPSHTITLLPPLQLANRLPYELKFVIATSSATGSGSGSFSSGSSSSSSNSSTTKLSGVIKSGEDHSVHYVSPLEPFTVELSMEAFPRSKPLSITPGATKDYTAAVDMYDANGRLLVLQAAVSVVAGSGGGQPCNAMTIALYAPYWVVNRSGLPLLFAQEGVYAEAAGQSAEHERARSISPLLYSHADAEAPQYATMRLGRMTDAVEPRWCNFFLLEKGTFYRRLRVTENANFGSGSMNSFDPLTASPGKAHAHYFPPAIEKIYEFGIDIRNGRDRYSNTKIVTIAPRYQIENLTSYKLEFAQKCMIEGAYNSSSHSGPPSLSGSIDFYPSSPSRGGSFSAHRASIGGYIQATQQPVLSMSSATSVISALPKSNMPFHWPATDMAKLLVVRIADGNGSGSFCAWSGSFTVGSEPSASFHLNIRDDCGRSYFLRVEILLQSATYFIVFTDANSLPPPVRIENFSQVPIEFYQAGTTSLLQRSRVRPNSSLPYALDEPLLPSHITVCAPGGASSTYDLNSFAPGDALTYDNFYYIAFEETFAQATAFGGFSGAGQGYFGPNYIADLDDDEQLMLMMLAGAGSGYGSLGQGSDSLDGLGTGAQMLVLDVPDETDYLSTGNSQERLMKPVVLTRKERGKRSQLWRIDLHSRLIHEGSSPPIEPGEALNLGFADVKFGGRRASGSAHGSTMVLDVADEGGACYDGTALPLVIRRLHPSRERTQTWKWTEDGRLRCSKYEHLFVAPRGSAVDASGSTSFRPGNAACLVMGPVEKSTTFSDATPISIPRTQAVLRQKMRKGSGVLNVSIQADGPSRVLRIRDQQNSANGRHLRQLAAVHTSYGSPIGMGQFGVERSSDVQGSSATVASNSESALVRLLKATELELSVHIDSLGVSVINAANEEIIYLFMRRILLETTLNPAECRLRAVVMNLQVDNQLRHCEKEVVLHVSSSNLEGSLSSEGEQQQMQLQLANSSAVAPPAITFIAQKLFIPNVETNVFKNLQVSINDLVLNLEEVVLLKLLEFAQYDPVDSEMDEISSATGGANSGSGADALYHANRSVSSSLARSAQYYFAYLLVQLSRVKLSVLTSAQAISSRLSELKKKAGIKLIRFEDALIQLRPYHRVYSLMTKRFLVDSVKEHYRAELRSQAAKILGTVDFLGNPVGFLNDVADGLSDLTRGNLSGLLWSVTHGISDSTAKFTSVLGESLGTVTMDSRYQEIRRKIRQESTAAGGSGQRGHLSAGALGLAHGLLGGITSIITQTYDGFTQGSVTGVLGGIGKGVLGTFTKPAVGVLDFAASAATAVRESSTRKQSAITGSGYSSYGSGYDGGGAVRRVRLPRTLTIDGRLTAYDGVQASWQARFYGSADFGPREYDEVFVYVALLADRHLVLLTTERLIFFHSTLTAASLEAVEGAEEGSEEHHHQGENIIDCPVHQLAILPLETVLEAVHVQMRSGDAQRFMRLNGLSAGSSSCLTELFALPPASSSASHQGEDHQPLVDLLELRTVGKGGSSLRYASYNGGGGGSGANSPKMSTSSSTSGSSPLLNMSGFIEYPKALQLCYLYGQSPTTMERLVQLINEAKHLQEERKFEVAAKFESSK